MANMTTEQLLAYLVIKAKGNPVGRADTRSLTNQAKLDAVALYETACDHVDAAYDQLLKNGSLSLEK